MKFLARKRRPKTRNEFAEETFVERHATVLFVVLLVVLSCLFTVHTVVPSLRNLLQIPFQPPVSETRSPRFALCAKETGHDYPCFDCPQDSALEGSPRDGPADSRFPRRPRIPGPDGEQRFRRPVLRPDGNQSRTAHRAQGRRGLD